MNDCCNANGQCTRGHGCPSGPVCAPKKQTLWLDDIDDGEPLPASENAKLWMWIWIALAVLVYFGVEAYQLVWGVQ